MITDSLPFLTIFLGHAVSDCPKKRSSRVCWNCRASLNKKKIKTTINNDEEYDEEGVEKEAEDSSWVKWKWFLDDPTNTQHLMQLSPEKYHVIWYGRLLRRRNCLPSDLYLKLNNEVPCIDTKYIHPCFFEGAMAVVEATSRDDMAVRIRDLHNISVEDRSLVAERKLLTDILENL
ncbi:hypothetical protein RO3G_04969 [Rhizopus delemar RA 99-880]|uniref:Uncharacterized protein n=1 Tax=Rhizopus delemar (strain RA 99-880 / ATCC MYA-4621 / FGSC 9543 / NRRL 43880) TaxID=246409 RepID=I1BVN4_RHIO9|nr:hypothetical protein RO3G_04969 [Rhizopus delemar RA 99-880]|eukprot:EIE80264.1 hypothetical protein RO3G_04969 [Rhizopus delemar RA 99-880]